MEILSIFINIFLNINKILYLFSNIFIKYAYKSNSERYHTHLGDVSTLFKKNGFLKKLKKFWKKLSKYKCYLLIYLIYS